jgi:hypothetical protein
MANLKALREKIKNITDYSPDLQQYNDQLDELVNDSYYKIWTSKRWNYATKEYLFKFIPDMLPTRDVITPGASINANVVKGSRQVTFSAPMDRLTRQNFGGQVIQIQNYEYTISKVVNGANILLDEPFHGTTNTDDVSWRIKRRYYDLPQDSIELLYLGHRDIPNANGGTGRFPPFGKLTGLMPRKDEQLNLRMDYAATYAEAYVWSPSQFIEEAYVTKVSPFVEEGTSVGFPYGTYLEVCWAFSKDGKVGALSEPSTVFFNAGQGGGTNTFTISFRTWDDQAVVADIFQSKDTRPSQFEGLDKVVYWNANYNRTTGERRGLPVWREFNNPGGSATRNTTAYVNKVIADDTQTSVDITNFNQIDPGNNPYIEMDGQYNRIRPYPRVDAWDEEVTRKDADENYSKVGQDFLREGVARYYYKPAPLGFHTDSPEMPAEFHQLIVYDVLATLYDKVGSMANAENYRRRIEKEIKRLERRYTDHQDSLVQRGQFNLGGNRFFYYDYASLKTGG